MENTPERRQEGESSHDHNLDLRSLPISLQSTQIIQDKPEHSKRLLEIIEAESTNLQWRKLALNWGMIVVLMVISLMRGSSNRPEDSLIGTVRCDTVDWSLFFALQILCLLFLAMGIVTVKYEYKEKKREGYEFIPGDFEPTPKNLCVLFAISFFGSFLASFCGIGPALLFCPILVMIGIEA